MPYGSSFDQKYTVDPVHGCHVWQGAVSSRGYPVVRIEGRLWLAHRYAYFRGREEPDDGGIHVHHTCKVTTLCVKFEHLAGRDPLGHAREEARYRWNQRDHDPGDEG